LPNHLDCSMEVLFAKAFLSTPGSTRGFVKPKGSKYSPFSQKGEGAFCIFLYRLFFYITKAWFLFVFFRDKCCNLFHALLAEFIFL